MTQSFDDFDPTPCWPHWLPVPERTTYGYNVTDTHGRTEMDAGTLVRRRFDTVDETVFTCELILRECEVAWLESFEAEYLRHGMDWFLMPLWVAGQIQHYLVQFVDRPKVREVKGLDSYMDLKLRTQKRNLPPVAGIPTYPKGTLPVWPEYLPMLQDSYSYEPRKMDMKGATELPTAKRVEFNLDEVKITAKMSLSMAEIAVFEWFEREVLYQGARWFSMPVWMLGEMKTYKVRFKTRPKAALNGFWTDVVFDLELEQREFLHPDVLRWLTYLSPEELFFFLEDFHDLLHVKLPGVTIIPDGIYDELQVLGG